MREIKFRQWDSRRKIMYRDCGAIYDGTWVGFPYVTWSIFPLMQYTGLKDKNGVEIYEGDILKSGTRTGVVIFDEGSFMISRTKSRIRGTLCYFINDGVEIIGNIYEDSELVDK